MKTKTPPGAWLSFTAVMLIPAVSIFSGWSIVSADDPSILGLLLRGEWRTFYLSTPLAFVLTHLYSAAPNVPWLSLTWLFELSLFAAVYSITWQSLPDISLRVLSLVLAIAFFAAIALTQPSFTTLTLFGLGGYALLSLQPHGQPVAAGAVLAVSSLDRFYTLAPLFALGVVLIAALLWIALGRRRAVQSLMLSAAVLGTSFAVDCYNYRGTEYQRWIRFNKARGVFSDYRLYSRLPESTGPLSREDWLIFQNWWHFDEDIFPDETVLGAADIQDSFARILTTDTFSAQLSEHFLANILPFTLLSLVLFSVLFTGLGARKAALVIFLFASFCAVCVAIEALRFSSRAQLGLEFLIFAAAQGVLLVHPRQDCGLLCRVFVLLVSLFSIVKCGTAVSNDIFLAKVNRRTLLDLKNDYASLNSGNFHDVIFSPVYPPGAPVFFLGFPWFEEDLHRQTSADFLPVGWLTRSPAYELELRRRSGGADFYHFLIGQKAVLLASAEPDLSGGQPLLDYYDRRHGTAACHHRFRVLGRRKYLSVLKLELDCL